MRALIFGSIGVLVETSELQRQAYNAAFAAHRLDWHW
ncbi:MAG: haloacid dehalogenase, partial [Pseudomonadota bacterium]|nr:haloacid dehalogenase [Pseudomonadota bacterium]